MYERPQHGGFTFPTTSLADPVRVVSIAMTRLFAGTPFDIPPTCDDCGKQEAECECTAAQKSAAEAQRRIQANRIEPGKQTARVNLQKRKGGRYVTAVEGLASAANDLPELLAKLQAACGTGGTVKGKEDLVELQGKHVDAVKRTLRDIGYKVRD